MSIGWKVRPIEITQFLARNLNDHPGSELGAIEVEFGHLPMCRPDKEGTTYHKERNSRTRSARKLDGAHHGVRPLVEIQILHFLRLFF
jgi:hypothetical protein